MVLLTTPCHTDKVIDKFLTYKPSNTVAITSEGTMVPWLLNFSIAYQKNPDANTEELHEKLQEELYEANPSADFSTELFHYPEKKKELLNEPLIPRMDKNSKGK